jgi:hypothetical protein
MNLFYKKLITISLSTAFAFLILELGCQALFHFVVKKQFNEQRTNPLHYYMLSDDPMLYYVLKSNFQIEKDGKSIRIDKNGQRDDGDKQNAPHKIALFGDSVPFGLAVSQEETPSARLQALVGDSTKVINFSIPGYGLAEIAHFFALKYPIYKPQEVYYVLNINDFSVRNTVYEGADNNLYRVYNPPFFKMSFFFRKAVARFIKGGDFSSIKWYRWLFEGNKAQLLPQITQMATLAKQNNARFSVILFPPAVGYENGVFKLQDVFDGITQYCRDNNITIENPVQEFSKNVYDLQDHSDHLTPKGCDVMAKYILNTRK